MMSLPPPLPLPSAYHLEQAAAKDQLVDDLRSRNGQLNLELVAAGARVYWLGTHVRIWVA